jgi:hypothetical protein
MNGSWWMAFLSCSRYGLVILLSVAAICCAMAAAQTEAVFCVWFLFAAVLLLAVDQTDHCICLKIKQERAK